MVPKPECPVCLEEMGPRTRIIQCEAGHFLRRAKATGSATPGSPSWLGRTVWRPTSILCLDRWRHSYKTGEMKVQEKTYNPNLLNRCPTISEESSVTIRIIDICIILISFNRQ